MIYGLTALNAFQLMFVIIAAGDIIKISEEILFLTLQAIKKNLSYLWEQTEKKYLATCWLPPVVAKTDPVSFISQKSLCQWLEDFFKLCSLFVDGNPTRYNMAVCV